MIDMALIMVAGILTLILMDLAISDFKLAFKFVVHLIIGNIFLGASIYTYDRIFWPDKVQVTLRYAYEECAYLGASIGADEDRSILASEPIKRKFQPETYYPFRFGVDNGNGGSGLPMRDVMIQIIFMDRPKGFEVRPVSGESGRWRTEEANKRFSAGIRSVTNQPYVVDAALLVKFPERGIYRVVAKLDGEGLASIHRPFEIKVVNYCD